MVKASVRTKETDFETWREYNGSGVGWHLRGVVGSVLSEWTYLAP
jgi:hypothetical protein